MDPQNRKERLLVERQRCHRCGKLQSYNAWVRSPCRRQKCRQDRRPTKLWLPILKDN